MEELLSISEAAARGIERLRKPVWACKLDHLKIDVRNGKPGLWTHCYFPMNVILGGEDPVNVLRLEMDYAEKCYEPYTGSTSESEEYKKEIETWLEVKARRKK